MLNYLIAKKDQEIAYKIWVELSTRKIGIPFEKEYDIIIEIYDSWYEFFKITRDLLKEIPVNKISHSNELILLTEKCIKYRTSTAPYKMASKIPKMV